MFRSFFSRPLPTRPSRRPLLTLDCLEDRTTPAALLEVQTIVDSTTLQVEVGDFDGDGSGDLIRARSDGSLVVSTGNGDGSFSGAVTTTLSGVPTSIVVGHFGGDANLDVVVAYGDSDIEMLAGAGDGTFDAPVTTTLSASETVVLLAKTNFNGDALDDIAIAGKDATDTAAVINLAVATATGAFTQSSDFVVSAPDIIALVGGDFNDDGDGDFGFATDGGAVSIAFGDGANGLASLANHVAVVNATGIDAADFTGDGIDDLVVSVSDGAPILLKYDGTAILVANTTALGASGADLPAGADVVAAKFNDSAPLDLAVFSSGTAVVAAAGSTGVLAGGFGEYERDPDDSSLGGGLSKQVIAVDLNGDGYDDVIALSDSGKVVVYLCRFKTTTTILNTPAPLNYGTSISVNARVRPDVDIAAGAATNFMRGMMEFYLNGTLVGTTSVSLFGDASLTLPVPAGPAFDVGNNTIVAKFTGGIFFRPSTSPDFSQQVNKGTVDATITGPTSSTYGDLVTFTVTLTPPQLPPQVVGPTGIVNFFMDGSVPLGPFPVVETTSPYTYTATFSSSTLPAGTRVITADYTGDANWNQASTSNSVTITIAKATPTIDLSAVPTGPIVVGQNVDFTAAFTVPAGTFASGTVDLVNNGSTTIASPTITTNSASAGVTSLPLGQNTIVASYAGDDNFKPASSNAVTIDVLTANEMYVYNAYLLLLNRAPDPDAQTWVDMLDAGVGPSVVILGIEGSIEYLNDVVDGLYQRYLGRAADPSAQTWVQALAAGQTIEEVTAQICGSAEYSSLHPSDQDFVTALYLDVLGRSPDPTGNATWLAALAAGESRTAVAFEFLISNEYRNDLVGGYYTTFLGRTGDSSEIAGWVNQLAAGSTDQEVLAGIFGSAEGYAKWSV